MTKCVKNPEPWLNTIIMLWNLHKKKKFQRKRVGKNLFYDLGQVLKSDLLQKELLLENFSALRWAINLMGLILYKKSNAFAIKSNTRWFQRSPFFHINHFELLKEGKKHSNIKVYRKKALVKLNVNLTEHFEPTTYYQLVEYFLNSCRQMAIHFTFRNLENVRLF